MNLGSCPLPASPPIPAFPPPLAIYFLSSFSCWSICPPFLLAEDSLVDGDMVLELGESVLQRFHDIDVDIFLTIINGTFRPLPTPSPEPETLFPH